MKKGKSVHAWRAISRRGVFEVLDLLEQKGRKRFGAISKEVDGLCLATLTSALTTAKKLGLIEKTSYKISEKGTLQEITADELKRGVKPQATLYQIDEKGKAVLELKEKLDELLRST